MIKHQWMLMQNGRYKINMSYTIHKYVFKLNLQIKSINHAGE